MNLFSNIISNYNYLRLDFTGFKINPFIFTYFAIDILFSILIIVVFYLLGEKLLNILFKTEKSLILNFFIKIALGYIFFTTSILILGMLNLFYIPILYLYYLLILLVCLFPLNTFKKRLTIFKIIWKEYKNQFLNNKLVNTAILSFLLIGFIKLLSPEVGVDAIWYHTDYPRLYLNLHGMMSINPKGVYYPSVVPALSDMIYLVNISLSQLDASRFIHFSFYLLCVLTLLVVYKSKYAFSAFAGLLFVTSPIIIRDSPSAYAEFPWILCWLIAVFILTNGIKHNLKNIVLPSLLIGATLATKLWMLPFFGVVFVYILVVNFGGNKIKLIKLLTIYSLISFFVPFLWYFRAWLLTGNPLFPTFWNYPDGSPNNPFALSNILSSFTLVGIKNRVLSIVNVSPFSIVGFFSLILNFPKLKLIFIRNKQITIFMLVLTIAQIIINYNFHRFVIPFFSIFFIILAYGVYNFVSFNKYFKFIFYFVFTLFFLYYFINTVLILPYGLGFADKNHYLSRILSRDNSSYFDFNYLFSKKIAGKDLVATYGEWGFYYADFNHFNAEDIFRKENRSLNILIKKKATKILIRGGDINWLCKLERLTDCNISRYKLISSYKFPTDASSQYLYSLN